MSTGSSRDLKSGEEDTIGYAESRHFVRVAVVTDVHGNLGALEAVLAHIAQTGVDHTVVAGDTVNILPHSKAC